MRLKAPPDAAPPDGDPEATPPNSREARLAIFHAALAAADPYAAVLRAVSVTGRAGGDEVLRVGGRAYPLARFDRVLALGAGKATARMALALEEILGERISQGLIVVKAGRTEALTRIEQVEAAHPVPDAAGVAGTLRTLALARNSDAHTTDARTPSARTLIICLVSGGASALWVAPAEGQASSQKLTPSQKLTLAHKQATTRWLLASGASIKEMNTVRKHLSAIKGGGLARAAYPATLLTLLVSDVIGDPVEVIASGPTAADPTTYADALEVIASYGLAARLPPAVMAHLARGRAGDGPETVKPGEACLERTQNVIVAGLGQALDAAKTQAEALGWPCLVLTAALQGEARVAARWLAGQAREALAAMGPGQRRCLLAGGETTVVVRGEGKGGRNQELALAFAMEIEGMAGVSLLSAGTDGTDGPTDAAGALVDGGTTARARTLGLAPEGFLARNDSYTFFQHLDAAREKETHPGGGTATPGGRTAAPCHLLTGPTGTNVMDVQILLLDTREPGESPGPMEMNP